MRHEMQHFFKNAFEVFVLFGVAFLPAVVAEFAFEQLSAVFTALFHSVQK